MEKAGMKVEVEETTELKVQLHKRFKHHPSLLAAMESSTEPVTESAMEPVTKPPMTIWKSIRDRVLRKSDLPLASEEGYDNVHIFYPAWTNSDRLLIKIGQSGLDLNEADREFAKLVPPSPPEEKTNLVLRICFFDKRPVVGMLEKKVMILVMMMRLRLIRVRLMRLIRLRFMRLRLMSLMRLRLMRMRMMIFYMHLNLIGMFLRGKIILLTDIATFSALMRDV